MTERQLKPIRIPLPILLEDLTAQMSRLIEQGYTDIANSDDGKAYIVTAHPNDTPESTPTDG